VLKPFPHPLQGSALQITNWGYVPYDAAHDELRDTE
jgi:hypothetical protein